MSLMSSFYGGRQGASIVIAKSFDGIDIPEGGNQYTGAFYAMNPNNTNEIGFFSSGDVRLDSTHFLIKRNSKNANNYQWKYFKHDGGSLGSGYSMPVERAEGMVQFFKKGAATTSIVNYGEYVIIDTIANLNQYNNLDNGKVYRRTMDVNGELGGAEYIGQIVGPQGESPDLAVDDYKDVERVEGRGIGAYNFANGGLVQGYTKTGATQTFEDEIKYAWANIKDEQGNIKVCQIGFKFPTLVQDFIAESISAYSPAKVSPVEGLDCYNASTGKWSHPFYQKWKLSIPKGIHGQDSTQLELVPSKTYPAGYKNPDGTVRGRVILYTNSSCTTPSGVVVSESLNIDLNRTTAADNFAIVRYSNRDYYVKKIDCYMDMLRYKETSYENSTPAVTYHNIGLYNTIEEVQLSNDGVLTVYFSAEAQPVALNTTHKIRWIAQNGVNLSDKGVISVRYNTNETQNLTEKVSWIDGVSLAQNGNFKLTFNNDGVSGDGVSVVNSRAEYNKTLNWIDQVSIDRDGSVKFYYNSNKSTPAYQYSKFLKTIEDTRINTGTMEGAGNQKISIKYNTESDYVEIGNPINYIVESCISVPNETYPDVPYNHLLVYYSDPALRAKNSDKFVRYPSTKLTQRITTSEYIVEEPVVLTEWVDLGPVQGEAGGLHFITNVSSLSELRKASGGYYKPEELVTNGTIDANSAGWSVTMDVEGSTDKEILVYDYMEGHWYSIGTISSEGIMPEYSIAISAESTKNNMPYPDTEEESGANVAKLNNNGIWLVTKKAVFAQ